MADLDLAPFVRPKKMSDHVYESLKTALLQGAISDDVVLTESVLADNFGVSRTPVREVLQVLEREGLLEPVGSRGKRVRRLRRDEVEEVFWLRRVIERAVVERLAERNLEPEELQELESCLQTQRKAAKTEHRAKFLEADSSFHIALARFTGSRKVAEIISNLRTLFQLVGTKAVNYPRRLQGVIEEHEKIVAAIRSGDPEKAKAAMDEHLRMTEELVIPHLQSFPEP